MKKFAFFFLFVLLGCQHTPTPLSSEDPVDRPPPPEGYSWQKLEEIGGACLKPNGWFFSKDLSSSDAYFRITKEDTSDGSEFLTGLTIQIILSVPNKTDLLPSEVAEKHLQKYAEGSEIIEYFPPEKFPPMTRTGATFKKELNIRGTKQSFMIHKTLFANDKTGTLYVFTFGAPEKDWDEALKIIQTINSQIFLNVDV